jgi:AraC family transcriptional regulator of adaptative response/methylated-DNA-[protein]-cysteine methyltransferase
MIVKDTFEDALEEVQASSQGNDTAYWQAVLSRDSSADGVFVYAVRSTRIYCRPSCPARKPKRENVRFFSSAQEAQQEGFRPCRRCIPQVSQLEEAQQVEVIQQLCRYIEAHSEEPLTLTALSAQAHLVPNYLQQLFKRIVGVTPHQYLQACRIKQVKTQMKDGASVASALYDAGYSSSSRLYEQASAQLGMTPRIYRQGGKGMNIDYTIAPCSLGRLLVGATAKGICAVYLGSSDEELAATLKREYPLAQIQRSEAELEQWLHDLLRHLDGQQPHLHLPLDVQATAFQRQVWEVLQAIPYGETRSYSEIAQALGDSKKARAVAQACAHNPVALVIPCHRVVRETGALGGYRWGIERKQYLLEHEQLAHRLVDSNASYAYETTQQVP